jgi:DNA-directed RNA polymerase I, II, and III subunit RPABC3
MAHFLAEHVNKRVAQHHPLSVRRQFGRKPRRGGSIHNDAGDDATPWPHNPSLSIFSLLLNFLHHLKPSICYHSVHNLPNCCNFFRKTRHNKMESTAKVTLFEDIFEVLALNPDGKKFERVNRLQCTGTTFECDLLLDINSEIYSVKEGTKLTLVLASTLHLDGSPADHFSYDPNATEPTLADNYDYVMHGRVFEMSYKKDNVVEIAASFGGLLMRLTGDQRHLGNILPDQRLYLLLKKD